MRNTDQGCRAEMAEMRVVPGTPARQSETQAELKQTQT